jgi:hypothetical protein
LRQCYVVTWQVASIETRHKLVARLKAYRTFCPIHRHCWAVVTEQRAKDIRDNLADLLAPKDRLFIVRSGTEAAWRNTYGPKTNEWLKKYL